MKTNLRRSKNCIPSIDDIPMYRKTPKRTAIGINRNKGDMTTEHPTIKDTNRELTLCSNNKNKNNLKNENK